MAYKPGQKVPKSGIYDVIHDPKHAKVHQVTCVKGERFPPCRTCGAKVEFRLSDAAVHIDDSQSF